MVYHPNLYIYSTWFNELFLKLYVDHSLIWDSNLISDNAFQHLSSGCLVSFFHFAFCYGYVWLCIDYYIIWWCHWYTVLKVLGSIGHPIQHTEVKIVDSETNEVLPPGSKGIVKVRGPQVMRGYYKVVILFLGLKQVLYFLEVFMRSYHKIYLIRFRHWLGYA